MKAIKPQYSATFHRDGTITFWNVFKQQWQRRNPAAICGEDLHSMSDKDQTRTIDLIEALEP